MFNKLKQFKDLRTQAKELQTKLAEESITVQEMGGKVRLTLDGNLNLTKLEIDDELMRPDKKDKIIEGITTAHGTALKKMQRTMALKMKEMGGLPDIPGLT